MKRFNLLLCFALALWGQAEAQEEAWSFEGELRQQAVYQTNLDFGSESTESLSQALHRLRLKGSWRPSPGWELHAGLSSSLALGSQKPGPNDQDPLYLEEGWLAVPLGDPKNGSRIKAGRQLFSFGTGRLVSSRLGPNIPLSFDGLKMEWKQPGYKVDLFAGSPVKSNNRVFGEVSGRDLLWGAYATRPWNKNHSADFYLLGTHRSEFPFQGVKGKEDRYSLGTRLFGSKGPWDYNVELVYQAGRFDSKPISAWTIATDNGWTLDQGGWKPRLGLKCDVASGGDGTHTVRTFHPLYPNFSYFSEAALISPSNLVDINPSLTLRPTEHQKVVLNWDFLWRYSKADGLYVPPGVQLFEGKAGSSSRIGDQISLLYQNQVSESTEFEVGFTHFRAGPFLREAGGRSTTFLVTSWTFQF